jgi:hypothetical protein
VPVVKFERYTELVESMQYARMVIFRGAIHHKTEKGAGFDTCLAEESHAVAAVV